MGLYPYKNTPGLNYKLGTGGTLFLLWNAYGFVRLGNCILVTSHSPEASFIPFRISFSGLSVNCDTPEVAHFRKYKSSIRWRTWSSSFNAFPATPMALKTSVPSFSNRLFASVSGNLRPSLSKWERCPSDFSRSIPCQLFIFCDISLVYRVPTPIRLLPVWDWLVRSCWSGMRCWVGLGEK